MKKTVVTALFGAFALLAGQAYAANADCEAKAMDKKLAGAAKTSFMKKCEKDATSTSSSACEASASEKKLAGAAKTSHIKKCMADEKSAAAKK